jgi:hypothetical protein
MAWPQIRIDRGVRVARFVMAPPEPGGRSDQGQSSMNGQQGPDSSPPRGAKRIIGIWFLMIGLLPTTVLTAFVLALVGTGAPSDTPSWEALRHRTRTLDLVALVLLLFFVLTISAILNPLQLSIVRALEGYWGGSFVSMLFSAVGVSVQRRRLRRLKRVTSEPARSLHDAHRQDMAAAELETYPDESLLLPTRLGNALRAAEAQAGQRYGLDTVTMFPRLYAHLSNRMEDVLADLRDQLDVAARLCAVLLMATAISTGLLATHGWWLLVPATTALLAWLAYRAAVRAAISYGEQIYVAFDLHRFDMLRGLHLPLPRNPREELEFNERLSEFFAELLPADKLDLESYQHGQGQLARAAEPHDPVRS